MRNLRRHHRVSSYAAIFFLAVFCLSGLVLNHRDTTERIDVAAMLLPPHYRHSHWNRGLMRGTLRGGDSVVVFGSGGMWSCDSAGGQVEDFNRGIPQQACARQIRAAGVLPDGTLLALASRALYVRPPHRGEWGLSRLQADERLTDLCVRGDSVIATGRSHIYLSADGARSFRKLALSPPVAGNFGHPSLFRTVWALHSGELFGMPGRLVADFTALLLLTLCAGGCLLWFLRRRAGRSVKAGRRFGRHMRFHIATGRTTVALTLLTVATGWLLRPPFLIGLAAVSTPPVPYSCLDSSNPWDDKLRLLRYDAEAGDWILYSSEGFFLLDSLGGVPRRADSAPPVSVMGVNVFERGESGEWIVGSFSGLYRWRRGPGDVTDCFSGEAVKPGPHPPFGSHAVAGSATGFGGGYVMYDAGTDVVTQPEALTAMPMSLWQYALEAHTGRLFFGNAATWFYVLLTGGIILWSLVSGFMMVRRKGS